MRFMKIYNRLVNLEYLVEMEVDATNRIIFKMDIVENGIFQCASEHMADTLLNDIWGILYETDNSIDLGEIIDAYNEEGK